jgi:hypothetical protein
MCFCVNNSNKVVFSGSNNSLTSLWNKGGTGTPKSSFYCTKYLHTTGHRSSAFVGGANTIGAPTKMIWGTGVFTKFSIELKDEDGKPHKVHLVANLRDDL